MGIPAIVRPLAGAGIEIELFSVAISKFQEFAPSRGRELKLQGSTGVSTGNQFAPSRGRELKYRKRDDFWS